MVLQKYGEDSIYDDTTLGANSSNLWRTIFPHFQRLNQMSCWEIGKGDISFWKCNWCGEVLNSSFNPVLTVRDGIGDFFASKLQKPMEINSIDHFISSWLHGSSKRAQFGTIVSGVIAFMLWELWKHLRAASRMPRQLFTRPRSIFKKLT